MTILHLIAVQGFGGSEKLALSMCEAQKARGHRVYAAVIGNGHLERLMPERGIEIAPFRLKKPLSIFKIAKWAKEQGVNVLHSHLTSGAYAAIGVNAVTRIPVVTHVHVYSTDLNYRLAARRGLLIAVSDSVRTHLIERTRVPADRIVTIRNGTDLGVGLPTASARQEARRSVASELGVDPTSRFVIIAARITPQKGQDVLLDAAPAIMQRVPDLQILLAGLIEDEEYALELRQRIEALGLSGVVHVLGLRHDVPRLLMASDVAAIPSRFEPFGLSVIEPMALGTPVVASRVGGVVEIIDSPDVGRLVAPDEPATLAQAIIEVLTDRDRAQQVTIQARAMVESRFSTDTMLDQIDAVYQDLTGIAVEAGSLRAPTH